MLASASRRRCDRLGVSARRSASSRPSTLAWRRVVARGRRARGRRSRRCARCTRRTKLDPLDQVGEARRRRARATRCPAGRPCRRRRAARRAVSRPSARRRLQPHEPARARRRSRSRVRASRASALARSASTSARRPWTIAHLAPRPRRASRPSRATAPASARSRSRLRSIFERSDDSLCARAEAGSASAIRTATMVRDRRRTLAAPLSPIRPCNGRCGRQRLQLHPHLVTPAARGTHRRIRARP